MGKSCCFTGHRRISPAYIGDMTDYHIRKLIRDNGVTDFYNGGSYGFDQLTGFIVCGLKQTFPSIKLHMVLPCCKEDQTRYWCDYNKAKYDELLSQADSVEYISDRYYDGCMRHRNEALVALGSDYCLCYVKKNAVRSGSAQTLRMAMARGVEIINIACII